MINWKKAVLYTLLTLLLASFTYLYIWEKPKLEKWAKAYVESLSKDKSFPVGIKIERAHLSLIPLEVEIINSEITPKGELTKMIKPFKISKVSLRPSLLDIIMGKFWIKVLKVDEAAIDLKVKTDPNKENKDLLIGEVKIDELLSQIPLSELILQKIKLNLNIDDKIWLKTQNLQINAFNEKSSLILSIKDPLLSYKDLKGEIDFILESQLMVTKNTVSIAKIKIVKDDSYFIASGHWLNENNYPEKMTDVQLKTRLKSSFEDIYLWAKPFMKIKELEQLKGDIKADFQLSKNQSDKEFTVSSETQIENLKYEKLKLGNISLSLQAKNQNLVKVKKIKAVLHGNNHVEINDLNIELANNKEISAEIKLNKVQIQSFLKESNIATIPVWLTADGLLSCKGNYNKEFSISCPGSITIENLNIKNAGLTKSIIQSEKINIAGTLTANLDEISYTAQAQVKNSNVSSNGVINFSSGFKIFYDSPQFDFKEIGPIADLVFLGKASAKGSTQGDSRSAIFDIDIKSENLEFEKYYFGNLSTKLNYKKGTIYLDQLDGSIESTRYSGQLAVDLINERINGDLQLPFFRMEDIQQIVLQKVDLENRFLGSGSGRLQINTPFDVNQLGFIFEGRLFKGSVFGEEYNEAQIKAESVDGIIIIQQALLQKEKTKVLVRGTISTELQSQLEFNVDQGELQQSSRLKSYNLPMSGQFKAFGRIFGSLKNPTIIVESKIDSIHWNKKNYGDALFKFDNSDKKTSVQVNLNDKMDFLFVIPEQNQKEYFINFNAKNFDLAPFLSHMVSDMTTRNYSILFTGEMSGKISTEDFWSSEFSATINEVTFDYRTNKVTTTIPTSIELKNQKIFLNEISFIGDRQFIKVTQPVTENKKTKFIINSQINIALFKLFAPFVEKIDGLSTIRIELSINDKDFKIIGSYFVSDSFVKFPGFPHAIENLSADGLFNQNKILINSIKGELAGGNIIGSGEVNVLPDGKLDLLISTELERVNLDFPKGFKTSGNGKIQLKGSGTPYLLSGEYLVKNGLIESNFGSGSNGSNNSDLLEGLLRNEVTSPLALDLVIKTENTIEVRNSLVEGYIKGDFHIIDRISSPRIKGEAQFEQDSIIRFRDNEFRVIQSSFLFEGASPINPKLQLRAKTRLNNYDVEVFLQGRANKPILTATSQPPVPENQIISMLAFGTIPNQFDQSGTTPVEGGQQSGFEIGTGLFDNNPLGRELKERYNLDVQFSSSFDDQNNTAVPKVTIRRKMGKDLIISVSQTTGNSSQSEGRVTYELDNQLSTIFRVSNRQSDINNGNNNNNIRQNNLFGIDLEYKREFD